MPIPKIAHFHWTGPQMSWLRGMSLLTFKKFNPTWEIRLHDTPPDIRAVGLPMYGQEADWTWWRKLYQDGGLLVATDVITVRPVPEEWLEGEIAATTNGGDAVYQFAVLGAEPRHPFLGRCVEACEKMAANPKNLDYQAMGVIMLRGLAGKLPPKPALTEIPARAYCAVQWNETRHFWDEVEDLPLDDGIVGHHWFGGEESSKHNERIATADSRFAIVRLANKVYREDYADTGE